MVDGEPTINAPAAIRNDGDTADEQEAGDAAGGNENDAAAAVPVPASSWYSPGAWSSWMSFRRSSTTSTSNDVAVADVPESASGVNATEVVPASASSWFSPRAWSSSMSLRRSSTSSTNDIAAAVVQESASGVNGAAASTKAKKESGLAAASRGVGREIGRESTEIFAKFCAEKGFPALILIVIIIVVFELAVVLHTGTLLSEGYQVVSFFVVLALIVVLVVVGYHIVVQAFLATTEAKKTN